MEEITEEDVKRGINMMSSGTAVGIDQWSPSQWKQLSPEAIKAITHRFTYIEKYGGMAWSYLLQYYSAHGQTDRRVEAHCACANAISPVYQNQEAIYHPMGSCPSRPMGRSG